MNYLETNNHKMWEDLQILMAAVERKTDDLRMYGLNGHMFKASKILYQKLEEDFIEKWAPKE